ncbi:MAG: helix-hairpin-helix domain-containing protein [Chloroflexota bacterium]
MSARAAGSWSDRLRVVLGAAAAWCGRNGAGIAAGILLAVAASLIVEVVRKPEPPRVVFQQPPARQAVVNAPSPQPASLLVVHLSGEVIAPGVYRLPVGARVNDALRLAGGPTDSGDVDRLNLAARLADGQQIVVPKRGNPLLIDGASVASPTPGRVNINTAPVAELDQLPGIGPVIAQRIVAYREQHGPFRSVDELRTAKLVNAPTFERIKDLVDP